MYFLALPMFMSSTNCYGNEDKDFELCMTFYDKITSSRWTLHSSSRMLNLKEEPDSNLSLGANQLSFIEGVNLDCNFMKYGDKQNDKSLFRWIFDFVTSFGQNVCIVYPLTSANSRLNSFKPMLKGKRSQRKFCTKLALAGFRYDRNDSAVVCEMCGNRETLDNFNSRPDSQLHHQSNCSFIEKSAQWTGQYDRHFDVGAQGNDTGNLKPDLTLQDDYSKLHHTLDDDYFAANEADSLLRQLSIQGNGEGKAFDDSIKPILTREDMSSLDDQAFTKQSRGKMLLFQNDTLYDSSSCISEIDNNEYDHLEINQVRETYFSSGKDHWSMEELHTYDAQLESTVPGFNYSRQSSGYESRDCEFDGGFADEAYSHFGKEENIPASETVDGGKDSARQYHLSFVEPDVEYQQECFSRSFDIGKCQRNSSHLNYVATKELSLETLPKRLRIPEMQGLLVCCALLTVKITRKYFCSSRTSQVSNYSMAIGTGNAFDHSCKIERNVDGSLSGLVFIEASRHLVEDGTEAKCVFVEFLSESQLNPKVLKVETIEHFSKEDGFLFLTCRTEDIDFINRVNQLQYRLKQTIQDLPSSVMNVLTNRAFLISYPHGGPQVLSHGKTAVVRYLLVECLTDDGHLSFEVEKISDISKGIQNRKSLRKMLMYSADTCPGSSGAPVITFKYPHTDTPGRRSFEMERWMHYGYYASEDMNVSYLKVCSDENLTSWGWTLLDNIGQILHPAQRMTMNEHEQIAVNESNQLPQLHPNDNNSADNHTASASGDASGQYLRDTTGPAEHPAYPAFITLIQRLNSFITWLYHNILDPKLLAEAGFFYAGYADCVRCFQCGLGLRSWKPNDDIYVEHQRFRPSCKFLQARLRYNTSAIPNTGPETPAGPPSDITWSPTTALRPTESDSSNQRKFLENLISEIQVPVANETLNISEAQIQESMPEATASTAVGPNESNSSNSRKYLETLIDEIQVPDTFVDPNRTGSQIHDHLNLKGGDLERTALKTINTSQSNTTEVTSSSGNEVPLNSLEAQQYQTPLAHQSEVLLRLLGKEKGRLEGLTKCRHCKVNPIQELFLPCGELYACSQCVDLFTHCPSCGKRILGTVTTYFS